MPNIFTLYSGVMISGIVLFLKLMTLPNNWALEFFWSPEKEVEAEVHDQLIRWIDMGLIDLADFVSHVFDFDDAMKGFDILENHLPADKIVIKIGEE